MHRAVQSSCEGSSLKPLTASLRRLQSRRSDISIETFGSADFKVKGRMVHVDSGAKFIYQTGYSEDLTRRNRVCIWPF